MAFTRSPVDRLAHAARSAVGLVLQLVLAAAGLVFVIGAVALGLALGSVLVLWALLRGQRPVLRHGMPPGAAWARFQQAARQRAGGARRAPPGEVIDAEVREVPDR